MPLIQVVVLALLQGITEFLPISSSAHLALAPWLLGWKDQGLAFDIALHAGTLLAVLLYFFRDWVQIIAQGLGFRTGFDPELKRNPNLLWLLAAGSIPIGVAGLLLKDFVESTLRTPMVMGGMLIAVALVMELADRAGRQHKSIDHVSMIDTITIGFAQVLALVPGTSRSGITIAAGLFRHLDRPTAARFSFLLATPAVAAAAAKAFYDLSKQGGIPVELRVHLAVGIAVSAISGCFAISFLINHLKRHSLRFFVYYRIILGIIVIALAFRHPAE
ncbi:MAG: undecaprenyl-diphosphate phosphatase [Acidobacteriia bacterium]|nr:undecaprenyl-diphosphate phosphatase [Terriglobia bacterium]